MDPRELLGMIAFFSEALNGDELFMLAKGAKRLSYPAGGVMMREDEAATSMVVIESGKIAVTVGDDTTPVSELYAGDFIGEMSLLTGEARQATVTAVEPVVAWEIDKAALAEVLRESPALADRLAETMEKRLLQIERAQGAGSWGMTDFGKGELLILIRKFYSGEEA